MGVTVGREHFKGGFTFYFVDFDDGDIEGTTTQVINSDLALTLDLVDTVSKRGSRRFVDDTLDFQTGDATGILGGLTLGVGEVGRNRDHSFGYWLTEEILSGFLHLLEHFSRDLRWCHLLTLYLNPGIAVIGTRNAVRHDLQVTLYFVIFEATTDQTLDGKQGIFGVGDSLTLGGLTNQNFTIIGIGDDGRGGTIAFGVLDNTRMVTIQNGYTGVGRTQVNTDDLTHFYSPKICNNLRETDLLTEVGTS